MLGKMALELSPFGAAVEDLFIYWLNMSEERATTLINQDNGMKFGYI